MVAATRLSRPLQRRCAQCRRVQDVKLPALYHVVVPNQGGGTRRDGGYDCRFCATPNIIAANEMPQGLLLQLPSREEQIAAVAAAKLASAVPAAEIASPAPAPAPPSPAPHRAEKRLPPPSWITGAKARATLVAAFGRARDADDGHCTAFIRTPAGALSLVDARERLGDGDILDWLDRTACELLVLGGSQADGSRWKAVFHPVAGAATLAVEPRNS